MLSVQSINNEFLSEWIMKKNWMLICAIVLLFSFTISCSMSTEKYAQKENGRKYGIWELEYNADDVDTYWPSLKLTAPIEGEMVKIQSEYNWWNGKLVKCDTTETGAGFKAFIRNLKSKNDAKYYNSIKFKVFDADSKYYRNLEHRFLFNEGQKDSISFSVMANEDNYFVTTREQSEAILNLFSSKNPVDLIVVIKEKTLEVRYHYIIEGTPNLNDALELNHKRRVLAEKEDKKKERRERRQEKRVKV